MTLAQRVEYTRQWLLQGEPGGDWLDNFPAESEWISALLDARKRVMDQRREMITALDGEIKIHDREIVQRKIAVVESTHRAATMLGYLHAPVVVAVNPRCNGDLLHLKYTVCQWRLGYVNLDQAAIDLNQLEMSKRAEDYTARPRWGGSKTIIGSEQGASSLLSIEQVMHVVRDNLIA